MRQRLRPANHPSPTGWSQQPASIDIIELGADIARSAGDLAEQHGLRGYLSVHLAAALAVADDELVFVTGDTELATAAMSAGIAVAPSTP